MIFVNIASLVVSKNLYPKSFSEKFLEFFENAYLNHVPTIIDFSGKDYAMISRENKRMLKAIVLGSIGLVVGSVGYEQLMIYNIDDPVVVKHVPDSIMTTDGDKIEVVAPKKDVGKLPIESVLIAAVPENKDSKVPVVDTQKRDLLKRLEQFTAKEFLDMLKKGDFNVFQRQEYILSEFKKKEGANNPLLNAAEIQRDLQTNFLLTSTKLMISLNENPAFRQDLSLVISFAEKNGILKEFGSMDDLYELIELARIGKKFSGPVDFYNRMAVSFHEMRQFGLIGRSSSMQMRLIAKLSDEQRQNQSTVEALNDDVLDVPSFIAVDEVFKVLGESWVDSLSKKLFQQAVKEHRISPETMISFAQYASKIYAGRSYDDILKVLIQVLNGDNEQNRPIANVTFDANYGVFGGADDMMIWRSLNKKLKDNAQAAFQKGGIDFNPDAINLETQNPGEGIKFKTDPAQIMALRDSAGFDPVIISIDPVTNLHKFLGINK